MHGEFKVGDFSIHPRTSTISRGSAAVRVEPKVMDFLVYLAHRAGEPVGKDQILQDVWAGAFVTEEVLSNTVWKLRHIFGDDARNPRYIETIQKRGYRLLAPVRFAELHDDRGDPPQPVVGREKEKAELEQCLSSARAGRGLLVCVSGEAGIGKTTFIRSFLHEHTDKDCFVGRGKCSERLAGTGAYLPILEALDSLTRSGTDPDMVHLLRHTAPSWYVQVFPQADDAASISARTAGSSLERMKRELTLFLNEVSEIRPVILFFDDVHWSDVSSVDIWTYLCDRCQSMRILIMVSYRPELLLPAEHVFVALKNALQAHGICRGIRLNLLSCHDVATYVDRTFPSHRFPREFVRFLHLRTEGNPLFMVSLLSHLRRQEAILPDADSGCWAVRKALSAIAGDIPESLLGLIDLRIRLLGEENRRLLVGAAIQGHDFDSAVVARALGMDQSIVEEQLDRLDKLHEFIRRLCSPEASGQHQTQRYEFVHVLYLGTLRETLGPSRRATLCGAVAKAILEVHGAGDMALAARLASLLETARDFPGAARHFLAAAEHASQVSADTEALTLARKGLEALGEIPESTERSRTELGCQMVVAAALTRTRGFGDLGVRECYRRAHDLSLSLDDESLTCRSLLGLASYWLTTSHLDKAVEIGERCRALAESSGDPDLQSWCCLMNSTAISHLGEPVRALEYARRCAEAEVPAKRVPAPSFGGFDANIVGRGQLARILWLCGYPDQARARARQALEDARGLRHPYTLAFALLLASWVDSYLDDTSLCLSHADESIAISIEYGFPLLQGWARSLGGWAMARGGDIGPGIGELDRGLEFLNSVGCLLSRPEFLGLKALALARNGTAGQADTVLDEALRITKDSGDRYFEAELFHIKAQILLDQPSAHCEPEAESWIKRAIEAARQQGSKSFELRAATSLARLYLEQDRLAEALDALSPVHGWFTEGFQTPDLRAAQAALEACRGHKAPISR